MATPMTPSPVRSVLAAAVPVGVNLLLGVPAIVPPLCGWWLWTRYLPMDCRDVSDLDEREVTDCDLHTLDHASAVMFIGAVSGLAVALLVSSTDAVAPRRRGEPRRLWAASAALVPVPFAVLWALARVQGRGRAGRRLTRPAGARRARRLRRAGGGGPARPPRPSRGPPGP